MKIRKKAKALMSTSIVLSAALLFVGCGTNTTREIEPDVIEKGTSSNKDLVIENDVKEENQDKDTTYGSDVVENQKESAENTNIYDYILTQYSDMVQNDFYISLRDSDNYDSSFGEDIGLEIRTHKQDIYYTFYDIDGNGTMELIIAGGEHAVSNPTFSPWNYDLYGYDGNKVVSLFPDMELGGRSNFSFHGDGVIEVVHSLPQREICIEIYKIGNDGVTPELVDRFYIAADLTGEKAVYTYFQNGQTGSEISEEAYRSALQGYETPLAEELVWEEIY